MSVLKGKTEKEALYQTVSVVLRELVDLDLGFIIMLILKRGDTKRKREREMFKSSDQYSSKGFPQRRFGGFSTGWEGCLLPQLSVSPAAGGLSSFMPKPRALPKGVPSLPALPTEELDFESLLHLGHKGNQPSEPVT